MQFGLAGSDRREWEQSEDAGGIRPDEVDPDILVHAELAPNLLRFPRVLGGLLIAPRQTLLDIEARERGGFLAVMTWCLLAAFALRFSSLTDAVVGFEAGGGLRVVSVLVVELTQAIPVALGAALAIVVFAGAKRDPSIDLELGCAVAIPFLFARAVFRAAVIVAAREPPQLLSDASYAVAGAWALALVVLAVAIARRRPQQRGFPQQSGSPQRSGSGVAQAGQRLARVAGWAALGVLAVGLIGNVRWTAGHFDALGPVSRGSVAPDFTLPRVDGKPGSLALSSLRGRVVVLDFWATWCPPCLAALPMMHELARELESQGVTFVGVDSDGADTAPESVTAFLNEHGAPYPVVYDDGSVNQRYRIKVLPTVIILGTHGAVERVFIGSTSRATLAAAIETARSR